MSADTGTGPALTLACRGRSQYAIYAADESPAVVRAATELQHFLEEATGAHFPLLSPPTAVPPKAIVVNVDRNLADEELEIRVDGEKLLLSGGSPRGAAYAVYQFLEKYVGCRWFTRKVSRIPTHEKLEIGALDGRFTPRLEYREPFFREAYDADWCVRNRMNSNAASLGTIHGGKVQYGHFVHTFNVLLPPEKHFKDHPEWYSEIDGKRTDDHTQLCLTNPEVLEKVIEGVRGWIRERPDATIFSVSQNDWRNPCTCEKCRELDEREGGHMGTMLTFVNAVAEAIENEAPHVAIDTLAYQYTRKPPKTLRPRPNVIIRLCSIECCFAHPLESDCAVNQEFADDIRGWSKIADRLYVWDYVTNFHNYMMPWPNFNVLADNVRFFADHSVVGLFEQGSYADGGGGEAAELRAYVLAKLLWDPSADPIAARDEFIEGVYGNAAGFVKLYHDLYHEPVAGDDVHLHIFCDVDNPHITEEVLRRGDALLTQAEAAAESREVRERVEVAHLPVQYAMIRTMDADDPARKELLDHFLAICEREGFKQVSEQATIENWVKTGAGDPNDARVR